MRRERNKIAAAKCRNRRRELIDTLQAVSMHTYEDSIRCCMMGQKTGARQSAPRGTSFHPSPHAKSSLFSLFVFTSGN